MNHLLDKTIVSEYTSFKIKTEKVEVLTLDDFCRTNNIDHISYLKVDTEGSDFDVLVGAENMLKNQNIDLIELEAGINPMNKYHVPFELLKGHLEKYNYFLFGIYEQVNEWPTKEPHLRRINPVFVSSKVISENKPIA